MSSVSGEGWQRLNTLPPDDAREELRRCCGSSRWIEAMLEARPFASFDELRARADEVFGTLERADWLEAFAHHPRIGDLESLRKKFASTAAWASSEQASVQAASEETLRALADGNAAYLEKFGYIFIICATGRSADEMLTALRARLGNTPEAELAVAAGEQRKITHIRLGKLAGEVA